MKPVPMPTYSAPEGVEPVPMPAIVTPDCGDPMPLIDNAGGDDRRSVGPSE